MFYLNFSYFLKNHQQFLHVYIILLCLYYDKEFCIGEPEHDFKKYVLTLSVLAFKIFAKKLFYDSHRALWSKNIKVRQSFAKILKIWFVSPVIHFSSFIKGALMEVWKSDNTLFSYENNVLKISP